MAQKELKYPELVNKFGEELVMAMNMLKRDSLKPAMLADIVKVYDAVHWTQQLLAMFYNLSVTNYEVTMEKIVALEEKVKTLESKVAELEKRPNPS